ncbi:MAG TPA: glycosyltransferase [Gaiellaceae bacterium]|nr:glycosyltransferase [Gaiellaceae bacterium]
MNRPLRVTHAPVNMAGIAYKNVEALKRRGVDARLVVFKPQPFRPTEFDVNLNRPDGFLRAQLTQWRALARLLPTTDVFHFYFGLTLVPRRLQFPILRATGRKAVFHFVGSDIRGKTPEQLSYARKADARVVGSYDAIRWVPDADVIPPGIDLKRYMPSPGRAEQRPLVVHAPSRKASKGTEFVEAACAQLQVDLDVVHGVTHDEAVERYRRADIVVDQLNAGWYGIFAIEAMALGKPVVTFLHDEAVRRTQEAFGVPVPIANATKETLVDVLRPLVEDESERRRRGEQSRAYVEAVHDDEKIADRLLALYARL